MTLKGKKERRHINVLVLVRGGRPGISAVIRSNETHNVLFQPKYHIHKHNYSYYLSRGVLYSAAGYTKYARSNKAQHFLSPHNHTEVHYYGFYGFYTVFSYSDDWFY